MKRSILLFAVALATVLPVVPKTGETRVPQPPEKPMKVFVEIDGKLFEVVIARSVGAEKANDDIHKRFRDEAHKYGIAYLRQRLVLRAK